PAVDVPEVAKVALPSENASPPVRAEELKRDREFVNSIGMAMVWISPGKFKMGSPLSEKKRDVGNIEIEHEVEITTGYWIGKFEVTQDEYRKLMGNNPSKSKGPTLPVETVSWHEAKE